MRAMVKLLAAPLVMVSAACGTDRGVGPAARHGTPTALRAALAPASAYTATEFPVDGWFSDVNSKNFIVGMGNGRAIALQWGGTINYMSSGPGAVAQALAVNTYDMIVGAVGPHAGAWADMSPAFWRDYASAPKVLPDTGEAVDINDQGLVVGTIVRKGITQAFLWDVAAGSVSVLPALRGGKATTARAINNDLLILGTSESSRGLMSVLWRRSATGWSVQPIYGIDALDLDSGAGVVGSQNQTAAYGQPNYTGDFNVLGFSWAEAVSSNGALAVGTDAGAATGWPVSEVAFIADRRGTTTYLPWPANGFWRDGFGKGVTNCGLVVGTAYPLTSNWQPYTAQPVVWDPGC